MHISREVPIILELTSRPACYCSAERRPTRCFGNIARHAATRVGLMDHAHFSRVLRGWYLLEMLTPQQLPTAWFTDDLEAELDASAVQPDAVTVIGACDDVVLPWEEPLERQSEAAAVVAAEADADADAESDDEPEADDAGDLSAFTIFFGVVRRSILDRSLYDALQLVIDDAVEPREEYLALSAMGCTIDGRPLVNSLRISTLPWYSSRIRRLGLGDVLSKPVSSAFDHFVSE